jgi:hypothetical protein
MKKRPARCYFTFSPTKAETRKKGSATHYPPNHGLIELDAEVARHIFNCVRSGQPPKLFSQGWWDPMSRNFNVGLAIPRDDDLDTVIIEDWDAVNVFDQLMAEHER